MKLSDNSKGLLKECAMLSVICAALYGGYRGLSAAYNASNDYKAAAAEAADTEDFTYTEVQGGEITKRVTSDRFVPPYRHDIISVQDKFSGASCYINLNLTTIEITPESDQPLTPALHNDL